MKFFISFIENDEVSKVAKRVKNELVNKGYVYSENDPELVISIGGDGTFLRTIQKFYKCNPLFANINFGNLGYLCEFKGNEVGSFINHLLNNDMKYKEVSLLEMNMGNVKECALNEFRVETNNGSTVSFDVYIDDTFLETFKGDGCCITTSIGSSGIARSIGGALVDNEIDMIQFVEKAPIRNTSYCSLGSPFVLGPEKVITIRNIRNESFNIFYDCKVLKVKNKGEELSFKISKQKIKILKNVQNNYITKTRKAFINE